MRRLALLLLAAVLPLVQLAAAGNDCTCGGTPTCSITVSGYEVRGSCSFKNYFACSIVFAGGAADDPNGNWARAFLPVEKENDEGYYAVASFRHNYTVSGSWRPYGRAETYIGWERWADRNSIAYSDGTVGATVNYPQFGWTWQTGRPGGTVAHAPPTNPSYPTSTDWRDSANGPSKSFSSNTVVEGSGSISGWLVYSVWRGKVRGAFYLYGHVEQPSPPKPDTLSVWSKDASSGRALLNASVNVCWYDWYWYRYYCKNETTPTGRSGSRFKLTAYNSSSLWLAKTDAGWASRMFEWQSWEPAPQDPLLPGRYLIQYARTYRSNPLTGTFLVMLHLTGSSCAGARLQVEDPPGSDSYKTVAEDPELPWSYTGVLQLNNQRLRIVFIDNCQWTWPSVSGWVAVAEPLASAQPAGWEVYKGSDLVIQTTSATVGEFGSGDGSSYTAIALYERRSRLAIRVLKPDGSPAYGAWVNVDGSSYNDCADGACDGVITVNVNPGAHTVEILQTYYNKTIVELSRWNATSATYDPRYHWDRYTFWKWSDGDTSNPRTFTVNQDTNVTAYVWDEKRLWVLYEPSYGSDPWGVKAVSLPSRYNNYINRMVPWGTDFWLRPGESATLQAVKAGPARFLRWEIGTECYPRNPYTTSPTITLTIGSYGLAVRAVFRLGPTNQTLFLPGEGIPNPIFWPVYQQYAMGGVDGRKGTWLLNVSALYQQAVGNFNADNRTWIYALLVKPDTLEIAWVPVNGSWQLQMAKDWNALAHKLDDCNPEKPYSDACRYTAYTKDTLADFPQVVKGAPSKYRGWHLTALAAWRTAFEQRGNPPYRVSSVWVGDKTYALYNVTFKHVDSGWVYWQPVAVTALKVESAAAVYQLASYDDQLRRSPITMRIDVTVNWTYVPPNETLPTLPPNVTLWLAGFKPQRVGNVGVALENDAGVVVWAPAGAAYGSTGKLYTLSLGDTEGFYREPNGLNQGARAFKLVVRFVARGGNPGMRVDDSSPAKAELAFTLAPSIAVIADWQNNDPWKLVVDWDCFRRGSEPFGVSRMNVRYRADFYYEWGSVDPSEGTLPPLGRKALTSVNPTVLVSDVNPDYWVAFYPIPAGGSWSITPGGVVPVPLCAKYPPRAKGG